MINLGVQKNRNTYSVFCQFSKGNSVTLTNTSPVNVAEIKSGYFSNMTHINPTGIVAIGPAFDLANPHNRARLPAAA